jgi:hypothetical protein
LPQFHFVEEDPAELVEKINEDIKDNEALICLESSEECLGRGFRVEIKGKIDRDNTI